jgi:hypothetical protein
MSSALKAFRAQRDEAEQIHARLTQVVELLRAIRSEVNVLAQDESLRKLLQEEQTWLVCTKDLISEARHFRETEARRFWPAVWRRWAVAVVFALAAAVAFGAGHVWASRPYEAEIASLRFRVEVLDSVAARILKMTPAERRQFDALMKLNEVRKR